MMLPLAEVSMSLDERMHQKSHAADVSTLTHRGLLAVLGARWPIQANRTDAFGEHMMMDI